MVYAASAQEIPAGTKKEVLVNGASILIINHKGSFYAVEKECPHQGAPMNQALVKEDYISCPRHGYRFNLSSGGCKEHPSFTLATWKVIEQDGGLYLEMG
ncbi:MAG: Rieske (2Fe-2S) protein [Trichlorobacter sp.]